ncbi:MAG TPA: PAS domain S-box protein [Chthoniobacterales bacterium]|nr:PAS domain S-box protein [Chthoniobacterales bacterium]
MKVKPTAQNSKTGPRDKLDLLYRGILDTALDCIITMGADGRVLEFNPAAERMFGFSRQEAVGKELAELTRRLFSERTQTSEMTKRSNQALERTATRFAFTFCVAKTFSLRATLAPGGSRSSCSR